MITRNILLISLLIAGVLCFFMSHKALQLHIIDDNMYFRIYAIGILLWSIRLKIQSVSLADALCANIVMWLCIFNVCDEIISKTPAAPYKPYITSIITIVTTLYIYYRKCRKDTKK